MRIQPPSPFLPRREPEDSDPAKQLRRVVAMRLARGELDLPVMPEVSRKVLSYSNSDEFSYAGLAELIGEDPILASKLLRYANSIEIGGAVPIRSLPFALMRIGVQAATNYVVALSIRGLLTGREAYGDRGRELYRHALETAVAARQIATLCRHDADEAFLGGLMHDLGRTVVVKLANDVARGGDVRVEPEEARQIEDEVHTGVGALLAERWGLPDFTVAAARFHHEPDRAESAHRNSTAVTALADLYVNHSEGRRLEEDLLDCKAAHLLGLDADTVEALRPQLEEALARTREAEGTPAAALASP